jgi:hypothetical protein
MSFELIYDAWADRASLKLWLEDKPLSWARIIALRSAMRILTKLHTHHVSHTGRLLMLVVRGQIISWASLNAPIHGMAKSALSARAAIDPHHAVNAALQTTMSAVALTAYPEGRFSSYTQGNYVANSIPSMESPFNEILWINIREDCDFLDNYSSASRAAKAMAKQKLWVDSPPMEWQRDWQELSGTLLGVSSNYSVWIEWYERRIRGERAAFEIPGDRYRKEDKKILRRLAEATDKNFWSKGDDYINATLKSWIDEARARVAPPVEEAEAHIPPQEEGAVAYGVNAQGKVDRLPPADQVHLRDVPDQRRSYADLREAVIDLLDEGQRLGPRLTRAVERFLHSLTERFEDAEAYLVWRDGNALRRLYRAHWLVSDGKEPDPARLEAVAAEGLGGVLDLFNPFAFADDGIRAKDEQRISAQEQESARVEAAAAAPLISAILAAHEIASVDALDDIKADNDSAHLPSDDPYAVQVVDQANRTRRNWIAGLLGGARNALDNPKLLGKRTTIGIATGVGAAVGTVATKAVFGLEYSPLLEFIGANMAILQNYVAIAFAGYPHLPDLIERIGIVVRSWQISK